MRTAPDTLVERHQRLGDVLFEQEHRLFRTTLPDDYQPGRHADPNLCPLRLSPREMVESERARLRTELRGIWNA